MAAASANSVFDITISLQLVCQFLECRELLLLRQVNRRWGKASRTPLAWSYSHFDAEWLWQWPLLAYAAIKPTIQHGTQVFPTFRVARRYGVAQGESIFPADEIYAGSNNFAHGHHGQADNEDGDGDADADADAEEVVEKPEDEDEDAYGDEDGEEKNALAKLSEREKALFSHVATVKITASILKSMPHLRSYSGASGPHQHGDDRDYWIESSFWKPDDQVMSPSICPLLERLVVRERFKDNELKWSEFKRLRSLEISDSRGLKLSWVQSLPALQVLRCGMSVSMIASLARSPLATSLLALHIIVDGLCHLAEASALKEAFVTLEDLTLVFPQSASGDDDRRSLVSLLLTSPKLRLLTLLFPISSYRSWKDADIEVVCHSACAHNLEYLHMSSVSGVSATGLGMITRSLPKLKMLRLVGLQLQSPAPGTFEMKQTAFFLSVPLAFREQMLFLELCPAFKAAQSEAMAHARELGSHYPNLWAAQVRNLTPDSTLEVNEYEYAAATLREHNGNYKFKEADMRLITGIVKPQDYERTSLSTSTSSATEADASPTHAAVGIIGSAARMAQYCEPFQFLLAVKQAMGVPLTSSEQDAKSSGLKLFPMAPQRICYEYVSSCP